MWLYIEKCNFKAGIYTRQKKRKQDKKQSIQ